MLRFQGLDQNLRFLVIEVSKQLGRTHRYLSRPDPTLRSKILNRDDYVDHLRDTIESKCFSFFLTTPDVSKPAADLIRSVAVISTNLERIADHCVNIVGQTGHLDDPSFLQGYDYSSSFSQVMAALEIVYEAVEGFDTTKAMRICEAEARIDRLYAAHFEHILSRLNSGGPPGNLVTALFIFHYIERIGDSLLNIGEAILMAKVGERLKIRNYRSIKDAVATALEDDGAFDAMDYREIWGTRSGCRIAKLSDDGSHAEEDRELIYKEGQTDKIRSEKEKIEQWAALVPGLPPRVIEYKEHEQGAALLVEYLKGATLQDILLNGDASLLTRAQATLARTLTDVWSRTLERNAEPTRSVEELTSRIGDVLRVHPRFGEPGVAIGGLEVPGLRDLVTAAAALEPGLAAPFTVFGHGDFNLDNVIYDAPGDRIHFIDLHRSGQTDYVLDIAVMIVSSYRLPVFDGEVRGRLRLHTEWLLDFARRFATDHGDETFDARLCLALSRNLVTSTRFELGHAHAEDMFLRGVYLLERLLERRTTPASGFRVPMTALDF